MLWSIEILPLEIVVVEDFALAPLLAPRRRQLQLAHDVVGVTCFGAERYVEDDRGGAVIGVSGLGPVLRTFDPVVLL